ncbi:MAG: SH3 domain-containing protein, partial [Fibrobacterota bacterium]
MNITTAVFIVAALFHVTNLYARKTAYIRADVANIRMDAEANSELVARCIMNTKVRVDSAFGEWKNISAGNVKGWIHSSLLSGHFYSAKELADSIRAAESKKDMKKWADRLNTAFPHKEEYHRLLLNTYRDLSDSAGVNMLRYRISNSEEVYIARARFGQIQLLGKINRQGVFETSVSSFCVNHEDYEERSTSGLKARIKESDKKLKQTAMALTGRKWYSVSGTVSSVLFSRFSICPGEMESVTQNREYEQLWSDSTVSRWVSFGEYEGEAFFATSPIGSVKKENLPQQIDTLKARKEICQIERECPGSYTRQPEIDTKS